MGERNQAMKPNNSTYNSNRWDTRQLVTMAFMCAIAAILSFVEFPLFPAAPFLKYDASFVPAMVSGFAYGAGPGMAVATVTAVIHGLIMGDWVGSIMNICLSAFYIVPAALIYQRKHTFSGAVIGLVVAVVFMVIGGVVVNLTLGVFLRYGSLDAILPFILPAIVPFNLLKSVLNSVLTLAIYKSISNLITPKKDQVKGR